MRIVVTGGAGFIGRNVVERLARRRDEVVALVRDPAAATHLDSSRVMLVRSDLSDPAALRAIVRGADAVLHGAGSYRVGIRASERPAMWEANVGTTERVLDAALDAGVSRIVYVSTVGVYGDTHGQVPDETYRRDPGQGFLSWYDETKFRAHELAEARIAMGAPIVIVQPGQVYGRDDHSLASAQLHAAHRGFLPYIAFPTLGFSWVHVNDLANGIVAAIDEGRPGEAYALSGECLRMREALLIAARVGGRRPPHLTMPTLMGRLAAPLNDLIGGLPGMPPNLRETIRAGDGVTYWASHDKATRELGFAPRDLEHGVADTWGRR